MNNYKINKSEDEKQSDFYHAFENLKNSNRNFDDRSTQVAQGIATAIYALVHDAGKKQPSALSLIKAKSGLKFLDSSKSKLSSSNVMPPLVIMRLEAGISDDDSGMEYLPILGTCPPENGEYQFLSFQKWWEMAVLRLNNGRTLSRKNLVFHLRHERGAHVGNHYSQRDGNTAKDFADLVKGGAGKGVWVGKSGEETIPKFGPEHATVRQIGWEVEETIGLACDSIITAHTDSAKYPKRAPITS